MTPDFCRPWPCGVVRRDCGSWLCHMLPSPSPRRAPTGYMIGSGVGIWTQAIWQRTVEDHDVEAVVAVVVSVGWDVQKCASESRWASNMFVLSLFLSLSFSVPLSLAQTPNSGLRHTSFNSKQGFTTYFLQLQTGVYDILPSTTAVFNYVIGSWKLSANEKFFVGAQTVVSL